MTVSISGTGGVTFPDNSVQTTAATGFGFKNRIINGAMVIDQRNAGASVTPNNSYTLDRWLGVNSQTGKFTIQQNAGSVTPPAGFTNYLGCTSTSAYSVASGDYFNIQQYIEGFNVSDLAWGAASAATITMSFWVRSSLTGTFGGALRNDAGNRSYPFTYTISSANTWEQKSVTIAGDTSGTWLTTNGRGIAVSFGLGVGTTYSGTAGAWAATNYISATGATSVVGTNGATFYITGVQLEKGSTATAFDYRPYGTELALCQRYLPCLNAVTAQDSIGIAQAYATYACALLCNFPIQARTPATGIIVSSASHFKGWRSGANDAGTPTAVAFLLAGVNSAYIDISGWSNVSGLTAGNAMGVFWASASGKLLFTGCEL
jgi:hypothetical protein